MLVSHHSFSPLSLPLLLQPFLSLIALLLVSFVFASSLDIANSTLDVEHDSDQALVCFSHGTLTLTVTTEFSSS